MQNKDNMTTHKISKLKKVLLPDIKLFYVLLDILEYVYINWYHTYACVTGW